MRFWTVLTASRPISRSFSSTENGRTRPRARPCRSRTRARPRNSTAWPKLGPRTLTGTLSEHRAAHVRPPRSSPARGRGSRGTTRDGFRACGAAWRHAAPPIPIVRVPARYFGGWNRASNRSATRSRRALRGSYVWSAASCLCPGSRFVLRDPPPPLLPNPTTIRGRRRRALGVRLHWPGG